MTRVEWGTAGKRFYEAGVDRGVLYVNGVGVPWNGLVSVNEASTGAEPKPFYIDGVKYSNRASPEEFEATITAYTYPDEFAACDGTARIGRGLFASNQRRKSFDFAYRTKVGNDLDGAEHGYKIHLVYGALAAPSARNNATLADSVTAFNFAWNISTKPPALSRRRATSHFVIDSRETPASILAGIEDVLYGTDVVAPRMPTVAELVYRFESDPNIIDAGFVGQAYYETIDGGHIPAAQSSTVNGGRP